MPVPLYCGNRLTTFHIGDLEGEKKRDLEKEDLPGEKDHLGFKVVNGPNMGQDSPMSRPKSVYNLSPSLVSGPTRILKLGSGFAHLGNGHGQAHPSKS